MTRILVLIAGYICLVFGIAGLLTPVPVGMIFMVLAALLFYPVYRLILVLSVRRLQRKLARDLDDTEMKAQINRARVLSVLVCMLFSFLYNMQTVGLPGGG